MSNNQIMDVEVYEMCFVCGEEKTNVEDGICEDCYAEIESWEM